MIQIPSAGHLKYDRFKQNVKQDNFIEQILKALSYNNDNNYHLLSTIHLGRYLTETGDSGLTLSGQMSAVESASMMSDVGLNLYQLRIILRILRNKLGTIFLNLKTL